MLPKYRLNSHLLAVLILTSNFLNFHLGRNRNLQGLAAAVVKLWDKSLVAKIAIKRGVQDTNNKLMAAELKVSS